MIDWDALTAAWEARLGALASIAPLRYGRSGLPGGDCADKGGVVAIGHDAEVARKDELVGVGGI